MTTSRREIFALGAATAVLGLEGCASCPPSHYPAPVGDANAAGALIDAHCHLFNAKDLSAVRFIGEVVLEHYPPLSDFPRQVNEVEQPRPIDHIIGVLLNLIGADRAPTAKAEEAFLAAKRGKSPAPTRDMPTDRQLRQDAITQIAAFLQGKPGKLFHPPEEALQLQGLARTTAENHLRRLIYLAAQPAPARGEDPLEILGALSPAQSRRIAADALNAAQEPTSARVVAAGFDIRQLLGFLLLFPRQRHCLVETLTQLHRAQKVGATSLSFNPQMLVPAMVDYGRWLHQDPDEGSTFADQVDVWAEIARRDGGPAVHGYVAYCPLRQALFDARRLPQATACTQDPYEVVKRALETHGFLGVKLYPPMGFQAMGNATRDFKRFPFPERVLNDRFGRSDEADQAVLGQELDAALNRIYDLCHRLGAPIMAHGGNSIAANHCTGELADPFFWRGVFDRGSGKDRTAPAIMLAHYGDFDQRSKDPQSPGPPPSPSACWPASDSLAFEETWEASICRYIQARQSDQSFCPVFIDVSMLLSVSHPIARQRAVANFKTMLSGRYSFMRDHMVFGTDWSMLALHKEKNRFTHDLQSFLGEIFGDDHVMSQAVLRRNFLRFANLKVGGSGFDRLAAVYDAPGAPTAKLRERLTRAIT